MRDASSQTHYVLVRAGEKCYCYVKKIFLTFESLHSRSERLGFRFYVNN